ncbi:MAG: AraC family transcriptional regulator [Cyclobacteriaceae bacterium]|nr:AraC family transcriptional regulator [Cyclobacteriaceae bacterium HetDA_MAG_MS6]
MSFFDFIAFMGFLQALVIAVAIFSNKIFQNATNKYFAYFLILLSIIGFDSRLSEYYTELGPFWELLFDILGDDIPWVMLVYLPLFKFFTINSDYTLPFSVWWLSIPFFLFTIINGFIDLDMEFGVTLIPYFTEHRMVFYELEDYISLLLFSGLHLFAFFKFVGNSENKWLIRLWWYTGLLMFVWGILVVDQTFFDDAFFQSIEVVLWVSVSVFVYWLMYSGLFQFNLANNRREIRDKLGAVTLEETPRKTGLSVKSKAYFDQLMELMLVNKLYRNPDLGREALAEELGISTGYLSQLTKEYANKSFTNFINDFRVEDAKRMLTDTTFDAYDHLSIGLEAGFKSKSAYYTTFKSYTGQTPSQFKKLS